MKTLQEKINEYAKENEELLKKIGIFITPTLIFPNNKIPFLSKIAIKILNRAGGRIDFLFNEIK